MLHFDNVLDLLVSMAIAAVKHPRNSVIFDPYPSVFDPRDGKKMVFDPNRKVAASLKGLLHSDINRRRTLNR